ncbi:MAG TPA: hypothetical protein VK703_08185 [Candidatus Acidoferrales bacterium]|nr:hypothetical protein [Candidatus Acidoferrales bacterium]
MRDGSWSVRRRSVSFVDQFPANTPALASSYAGASISTTRAHVGYVTAADSPPAPTPTPTPEPSTIVQLIVGRAGIALFLKLRHP